MGRSIKSFALFSSLSNSSVHFVDTVFEEKYNYSFFGLSLPQKNVKSSN